MRPASRDGKLTAPARMAADRVARRRERADQILALDPARGHADRSSRRYRKLRWRIERDYKELKRTRPRPLRRAGLARIPSPRHHATLCIAAYGFLIRERAAFPPSEPRRREGLVLPRRPRPRGAPDPTRASRRELDRRPAKATDNRPRPIALPMPMLPLVHAKAAALSALVTQ